MCTGHKMYSDYMLLLFPPSKTNITTIDPAFSLTTKLYSLGVNLVQ